MPVPRIVVGEGIDEDKFRKYQNTEVKRSHIKKIITKDADVYTREGVLLLKFRKGVLKKGELNDYYDATYKYTVSNPSSNRGNVCGSKKLDIHHNKKVNSSILGYYDRWSPIHKYFFKQLKMKQPLEVRNTAFSYNFPEKMKRVLPLITSIDEWYKKLLPSYYIKQYSKARETKFKLGNTSFTTITTNVNFKTTIHTDKGDDGDGFGNLAVIERGKYKGGETCFPRYGIGVDVREGDLLFMNVHEWHGNLPVREQSKDYVRMSIVCYLRTKVWERTRGKNRAFKDAHFKNIAGMYKKMKKLKCTRKKGVNNRVKKTKKNKPKKKKKKKKKKKTRRH